MNVILIFNLQFNNCILPALYSLIKGDDLSWADKGEIKRIKEKQKPFALEVSERYFLELVRAGNPRVGFKERGCLTDNSSCSLSCHKIYLLNYFRIVEIFQINESPINFSIFGIHPLLVSILLAKFPGKMALSPIVKEYFLAKIDFFQCPQILIYQSLNKTPNSKQTFQNMEICVI